MNQENLLAGSGRRVFLKKSVYLAPALIALGQLSAHATSGYNGGGNSCDNGGGGHSGSGSHGGGHGGGSGSASSLKCNNGWGNGDQCAPGKSLHHNRAENNQHGSKNNDMHDLKKKVNHVGVDTHGGHEKDMGESCKQDDKKNDKHSSNHKDFFNRS